MADRFSKLTAWALSDKSASLRAWHPSQLPAQFPRFDIRCARHAYCSVCHLWLLHV